jgi:hypothetical protein
MRTRIVTVAIAATAIFALLLPAGSASASASVRGGIERERHGGCDPRGHWELSLDKENGRIEVDYEVTSRRAGQRWKVVLRHDGVKFFDGVRVTRRDDDDRPDFEVERRVNDRAGTDRFKARARNTVTGAVCRGKLSI